MSDEAVVAPLQEGSRWRHAKPSSDELADWFKTVPLDLALENQRDKFISGVVIIPASEKVKITRPDGRGTEDKYEQTFTPYVRVDMRVAYFHALAEAKGLIAVIEHVPAPRVTDKDAAAHNENMADGFWWHITYGEKGEVARWLCCTQRVALYREEDYLKAEEGFEARPLREGVATKQIAGSDVNMLAKAETGAVGRALGMAGILVVGTGIATAEDMQELGAPREEQAPSLPPSTTAAPGDLSQADLLRLQTRLHEYPERLANFNAWWEERRKENGWESIEDAPQEVINGIGRRLQASIDQALKEDADGS